MDPMPDRKLSEEIFDVPPLTGPPIDLDTWCVATSQHFVPLDVHKLTSTDFVGRMRRTDCGSLSVFQIEHTAAVVARTPRLIRQGPSDLIKVSLQLEGDQLLEQDGRVALLHPGDIAVYDTSRPYTLRFDDSTRLIVVAFPHGYLDIPRQELAQVTATIFPLESPLGGVVNPFLAGLAASLEHVPDEDGERLAQTALDLLMTVISGELRTGVRQDPRRQLLHEVLASIERMLSDPELTPTQIAGQHFISTRNLHALFADRGVTVSSWIRRRRLEHIRRDLADPRQTDASVAQIAASWGLMNASHFSRMFRTTFGCTPSEYRSHGHRIDPPRTQVPDLPET